MYSAMDEFREVLKEARAECPYPHLIDFARVSQLSKNACRGFEDGTKFPAPETLERMIHYCAIPSKVAARLRELHMVERAKRAGVPIGSPLVNVSELAERIQREVEYELKRAHIQLTPRTRRVCVRRIGMLLSDALGVK